MDGNPREIGLGIPYDMLRAIEYLVNGGRVWIDDMGTVTFNAGGYDWPEERGREMSDRDKFLIVSQESGHLVSRAETEERAFEKARRLASKHEQEYLVFKLVRKFWKKPTNVGEEEASG